MHSPTLTTNTCMMRLCFPGVLISCSDNIFLFCRWGDAWKHGVCGVVIDREQHKTIDGATKPSPPPRLPPALMDERDLSSSSASCLTTLRAANNLICCAAGGASSISAPGLRSIPPQQVSSSISTAPTPPYAAGFLSDRGAAASTWIIPPAGRACPAPTPPRPHLSLDRRPRPPLLDRGRGRGSEALPEREALTS
jgi:hypothetical protein